MRDNVDPFTDGSTTRVPFGMPTKLFGDSV
jgi:hypothetical protein